MYAGFRRLDRVELVVDRGCRAGQIVYFVDLNVEREGNIVAHQLKVGVVHQMGNIGFAAGEEVVHTDDIAPLGQQAFAQERAEKTRSAGHQYTFFDQILHDNFPL